MVLVWDDNLFFASKIGGQLQREGIEFNMISACTESELSEYLVDRGLVIINLNSRGFDSLTAISQIKKLSKAKILGFCGHGEHQLKQRAEEAGCDWVVPNSVVASKLVRFIRQKNLINPQSLTQA